MISKIEKNGTDTFNIIIIITNMITYNIQFMLGLWLHNNFEFIISTSDISYNYRH